MVNNYNPLAIIRTRECTEITGWSNHNFSKDNQNILIIQMALVHIKDVLQYDINMSIDLLLTEHNWRNLTS